MDWEGFAARLPEEPPEALLRWARRSCGDELGGDYTVYRCQRRAEAPTMGDLFENRTEGRKGWVTVCTCTCCGEDWITRKGETAGSFWVASGEDGTVYPADADGMGADYIEVTENDQLLCPMCGCMTTAVRAKTIGDEKTKRLQIAQLANIDGYTTVIYWLAENDITQYGSSIGAAPRYAYVLDGRGALRMYSHRRAGGYGMDRPGAVRYSSYYSARCRRTSGAWRRRWARYRTRRWRRSCAARRGSCWNGWEGSSDGEIH